MIIDSGLLFWATLYTRMHILRYRTVASSTYYVMHRMFYINTKYRLPTLNKIQKYENSNKKFTSRPRRLVYNSIYSVWMHTLLRIEGGKK